MSSVEASVIIDRPPADVFAYAADRHNRGRLLPDNFTDFRLLTDNAAGPGARFAFTIHTDRGSYESITEMTAYDPPLSFSERTTDGEATYETTWRFAPASDGTAVSAEMRYPPPAGVVNAIIDRLIVRRAQRRSLLIELLRLKHLLEEP